MSDNALRHAGAAFNRSIHACEIPMSTPFPRELLKAADIAKMEPTRAVHSLNPNAVRLKRTLSDLTGLTQFGVHLLTLMPGHESAEYHRHLYEEEFVYVLSGTGAVTIGERTSEIGPGDFLGFRAAEKRIRCRTPAIRRWSCSSAGSGSNTTSANTRDSASGFMSPASEDYVDLPKQP